VPVLVGVGRHDTQCPIAASELIADRVPDATLVVFEESNHFPFAEEPEAFRRAIGEFAARLAP
jgi:proline iminopeptidase